MEQQMEDLCDAPRPDPLDPTKSLVFCNAGWVVDGKCMANQMARQLCTSGCWLGLPWARPPTRPLLPLAHGTCSRNLTSGHRLVGVLLEPPHPT